MGGFHEEQHIPTVRFTEDYFLFDLPPFFLFFVLSETVETLDCFFPFRKDLFLGSLFVNFLVLLVGERVCVISGFSLPDPPLFLLSAT
ncbi:hypothetical protein CULT_980018 [[Clostridium] ultunense Esp]|nr:hypothetical protein CULT_980018 [[Clostridium] ultunense Esp]